jgi:hypothetical protein
MIQWLGLNLKCFNKGKGIDEPNVAKSSSVLNLDTIVSLCICLKIS